MESLGFFLFALQSCVHSELPTSAWLGAGAFLGWWRWRSRLGWTSGLPCSPTSKTASYLQNTQMEDVNGIKIFMHIISISIALDNRNMQKFVWTAAPSNKWTIWTHIQRLYQRSCGKGGCSFMQSWKVLKGCLSRWSRCLSRYANSIWHPHLAAVKVAAIALLGTGKPCVRWCVEWPETSSKGQQQQWTEDGKIAYQFYISEKSVGVRENTWLDSFFFSTRLVYSGNIGDVAPMLAMW